jgi:Na+/alanine symporter
MTKSHTTAVPFALALAAAPLLGGCQGAIVGNIVVLGITFGIFFGTLGLGRASTTATQSGASRTNPERSQPPPPRT